MNIREKDFHYFEDLYKRLDREAQIRFLNILQKTVSRQSGTEVGKINIVDDRMLNETGIETGEFVTRTSIKKAYKEAKEG